MMSESDQIKTSKRIREAPAGYQESGCVGYPLAGVTPGALQLNSYVISAMILTNHIQIRKTRKLTARDLLCHIRTFGPEPESSQSVRVLLQLNSRISTQ